MGTDPVLENEPLGSELLALRKASGLSQAELARRLDVSQSIVAYWESGRRRVPPHRLEAAREIVRREREMQAEHAQRHQADQRDRALARANELRGAVIAVVERTPGLTRSQIALKLGRRDGVRAAIEAVLASGEAHEEAVGFVDSRGRARCRRSVYIGPAAALFQTEPSALVPEQLRRERELLGLTQVEVAARLNVSPRLVRAWECGQRRVPPQRRDKLVGALRPSGSELRRRRLRVGWTQEELAAAIGASEASVSRWERGEWTLSKERWTAIARMLAEATPPDAPDALGKAIARVVESVRANPGRPRTFLLKTVRVNLTTEAIDAALGRGLIHERRVVIEDVHPRFTRRLIRRGLFFGPTSRDEEELPRPIEGTELREARKRYGWTQAMLAQRLGVSTAAVKGWERKNVVPLGRAAQVAQLLATAKPIPDATREKVLRKKLLQELEQAPDGLTRWEIGRRLTAIRHHGLVSATIAWAIEAEQAHERPLLQADGRSRLAVFFGPPPKRWAPGPQMSGDELSSLRREKGLSQQQVADLLGVDRSLISQWEAGGPIPVGRRAQIRHELAEAFMPPEPPSGAQLRELRGALGLSQRALAKALGIWPERVCAWETGRKPIPHDLLEQVGQLTPSAIESEAPASATQLRDARRAAGWSQARLGAELEVSGSTIHLWEQQGLKDAARLQRVLELLRRATESRQMKKPALTGADLRAKRTGAHLTQAELARKLGVSRKLISMWELDIQPIPSRRVAALNRILRTPASPPPSRLPASELRAARVAAGMTQAEVAAAVGVSTNAFRQWERGRAPVPFARVDSLLRILVGCAPEIALRSTSAARPPGA